MNRRRVRAIGAVVAVLVVALLIFREAEKPVAVARACQICEELRAAKLTDCGASALSAGSLFFGSSDCFVKDGRLTVVTPIRLGGHGHATAPTEGGHCTCGYQ